MTLPGGRLSEADYAALEARWIDRATADRAGIRRVDSDTGARYAGQVKPGDYSGLLIPYVWPGESLPRDFRLRRDHPDFEQRADGSMAPRRKYVGPPGRGGMLYIAPDTLPELLSASEVPILITEGEFKTIALARLAESRGFLAVGLQGVWNWKGTIGKKADQSGARVDVHGPIPDLARVEWTGRRVIIVFDADLAGRLDIQEARRQLTLELEARGAFVSWFVWPKGTLPAEKGIDDLLAARGPEFVFTQLSKARPVALKKKPSISGTAFAAGDWRELLLRNAEREPKALLANAITALRGAFPGALGFDEFHVFSVALKALPWNSEPHPWSDVDDILLSEWLQREGIAVTREIAGQAAEVMSREASFHPVRCYLDAIEWDRVPRLDQWLALYLGAAGTADGGIKYITAVGSRWLISAVARIFQPGTKADVAVILEGEQGIKKSTALRTLAGDWFADEIADLGSKDAALQTRGVWIIELAELDAMSRAEASRIKSFMSRSVDRFRPPYGKRIIELPRQCVFAGTVNRSDYLDDETGGRRWWPVRCGTIDIESLARDRDQLWAEAVVRYRAGESWWLESNELIRRAEAEQAARYGGDAWDSLLIDWADNRMAAGPASVSTAEALEQCLSKPRGQWTKGDAMRVARCFRAHGWERFKERNGGGTEWRYRQKVPTLPGGSHQ